MKSKLTLSIETKTIQTAKIMADERGTTVSKMFSDFIDLNHRVEEKLSAFHQVSGIIENTIVDEPDREYSKNLEKNMDGK